MTEALIRRLTDIVGPRHCLTDPRATERFRKGFRSGIGEAAAVVTPGTLLEMWRILQAVVDAGGIMIMQAANTGLTEGSTPKGSYDRPVVIVSTLRLDRIHLLDGGRQILSLPGGTLYTLEKLLAAKGRTPHSVIGSSCLGASIVGGVCNNSGGALVRRGPVYTELALFAQLGADGVLRLVNHLILKVSGTTAVQTEGLLRDTVGDGWFACDKAETAKAMLHRFAAAGAAVRHGAVHPRRVEEILALDIALRRNDAEWFERLPEEMDALIERKIYYGHFLCHVLHQDYVVRKGVDVAALKAAMLARLDARGAEYPAEHNVGHIHAAKPALADHYAALDPTDSFNPGIGKTPRHRSPY